MKTLPSRALLTMPVLRNILAQCRTSTSRRRVVRREITIIQAQYAWGFMRNEEALLHLDIVKSAFLATTPAFGPHFPETDQQWRKNHEPA